MEINPWKVTFPEPFFMTIHFKGLKKGSRRWKTYKVFQYIVYFWRENHRAPTLRDMVNNLSFITTTSIAQMHVDYLREEELIIPQTEKYKRGNIVPWHMQIRLPYDFIDEK